MPRLSDRASRSEFWWWILFNLLCGLSAGFVSEAAGMMVALALPLPTVAVQVRRLHDIGKSGWWVLVGLIPLLGGLILIVFSLQGSDGPNEFGAAPAAA